MAAVHRQPFRGDERIAARKEAAERYADGATIREVADELGRPFSDARALLMEAGVAFRPPGLPPRPGRGRRETRTARLRVTLSVRTAGLLARCYPGQVPAAVIERAVRELAEADGHEVPEGRGRKPSDGREAPRRGPVGPQEGREGVCAPLSRPNSPRPSRSRPEPENASDSHNPAPPTRTETR